jgi:hypothetical protein
MIFDGDMDKNPLLKEIFAQYDNQKSWVLVV